MFRGARSHPALAPAFAGDLVASPAPADHPYMLRAFNPLTAGLLRNGTPDKGGRRVRAIALTNQAMQQGRPGSRTTARIGEVGGAAALNDKPSASSAYRRPDWRCLG